VYGKDIYTCLGCGSIPGVFEDKYVQQISTAEQPLALSDQAAFHLKVKLKVKNNSRQPQ